MNTWIIILIVVVILVAIVIMKYNSIIALKNKREQAFGDIDVQLKLRFDFWLIILRNWSAVTLETA